MTPPNRSPLDTRRLTAPFFICLASVALHPVVLAQSSASPASVFLEFVNAPARGQPLREVPRLTLAIGGQARPVVVDTGSTGVVLSANSIPDLDRLASLGPGSITYSSSGRIMVGRWVVTPLTIGGRSGEVHTRPMPVLAVDAIACTANARRCTPVAQPRGVAMLGIGFGREHDRQPQGTPDHNPLLNLTLPVQRGYVLTRSGIGVGTDRSGFVTVKLARDPLHGDWSAAPACITLNHGSPACGTVLVDTGITDMYLTMPVDRLPPGADNLLPVRTMIGIDLAPGISTAIRVGDLADDAAPSAITLSGIGRRPTFVNTGVHLLNRFDLLYDANAGLIGYRTVK